MTCCNHDCRQGRDCPERNKLRQDITRMAQQAGFPVSQSGVLYNFDRIASFAAIVATAEREACAQITENWNTAMTDILAGEIRARGQK